MENQSTPLTYPEKKSGSIFSDLKAGHVAIRTSNYDEIIKWYNEKLDFRIIHEWNVGEMQLAFIAPPNDNDFIIEILGVKELEQTENTTKKSGYDHICFSVGDLDKTVAALTSRNVAIVRSFVVPAIGKRVAFIADPVGNVIEFCEDIK